MSHGTMRSKYKPGRKLGNGQFGVVREVEDRATGRVYACKVVEKPEVTGAAALRLSFSAVWGCTAPHNGATSSEDGTGGQPTQSQALRQWQAAKCRERLKRELELGRELGPKCKGLVQVVDSFEDRKRVYLIMELCVGGTLAEYVQKRRAMWQRQRQNAGSRADAIVEYEKRARVEVKIEESAEKLKEMVEIEAGWILGQVASALSYLHCKGVLHRDLKPENVLISEPLNPREWLCGIPRTMYYSSSYQPGAFSGTFVKFSGVYSKAGPTPARAAVAPERVAKGSRPPPPRADIGAYQYHHQQLKIADLGLAENIGQYGVAMSGLVGSPAYVAPEVVRGDDVSFAADIWGLGIILYFLLTNGRLPFSGRNTEALLRNVRKAEIDFSAPALVGVSPEAKDLLRQLLDPNPEGRPQAAQVCFTPWVREQRRKRQHMLDQLQYGQEW